MSPFYHYGIFGSRDIRIRGAAGSGGHLAHIADSSDIYFDGIKMRNAKSPALRVEGRNGAIGLSNSSFTAERSTKGYGRGWTPARTDSSYEWYVPLYLLSTTALSSTLGV